MRNSAPHSNDVEQLQEEAAVARKWAIEKSDWLDNMNVQARYQGDQMSLQRRRDEAAVMNRLADRLEARVVAMKSREVAA